MSAKSAAICLITFQFIRFATFWHSNVLAFWFLASVWQVWQRFRLNKLKTVYRICFSSCQKRNLIKLPALLMYVAREKKEETRPQICLKLQHLRVKHVYTS